MNDVNITDVAAPAEWLELIYYMSGPTICAPAGIVVVDYHPVEDCPATASSSCEIQAYGYCCRRLTLAYTSIQPTSAWLTIFPPPHALRHDGRQTTVRCKDSPGTVSDLTTETSALMGAGEQYAEIKFYHNYPCTILDRVVNTCVYSYGPDDNSNSYQYVYNATSSSLRSMRYSDNFCTTPIKSPNAHVFNLTAPEGTCSGDMLWGNYTAITIRLTVATNTVNTSASATASPSSTYNTPEIVGIAAAACLGAACMVAVAAMWRRRVVTKRSGNDQPPPSPEPAAILPPPYAITVIPVTTGNNTVRSRSFTSSEPSTATAQQQPHNQLNTEDSQFLVVSDAAASRNTRRHEHARTMSSATAHPDDEAETPRQHAAAETPRHAREVVETEVSIAQPEGQQNRDSLTEKNRRVGTTLLFAPVATDEEVLTTPALPAPADPLAVDRLALTELKLPVRVDTWTVAETGLWLRWAAASAAITRPADGSPVRRTEDDVMAAAEKHDIDGATLLVIPDALLLGALEITAIGRQARVVEKVARLRRIAKEI
ncbi:hypothetical protein HDU84_009746 [Entophlyctis sp. JEL0112]|nr:hypothetical protein HDU84_009746 [Entophlyctis sp. JEL0112]